jgi:hypothetical protein
MKHSIIAVTLLVSLQLLPAQERLSKDEALKYAIAVTEAAKKITGAPLATDVDPQQPVAVREGDYGGMVLPQKKLSAEMLAKTEKGGITPVGQLWLHKLTPMRDGDPISSEKLRLVTVQAQGDEATVPMCPLGVKRTSDSALELVVFGKGKEPLLTAPLKAIDKKQEVPVDLEAERESESGRITLKILGKYQASFQVTELEL